MINFTNFETVNFYNDPIDVATTDEGMAYVSVSQIVGYLGLDIDVITAMFDKDPRVELEVYEGTVIVSIKKLNGFLMLLPYDKVQDEFRDDLLRYQVECFELLHDYWIHGVALNRRETPYDVTSKFKDERAVSRAALTKACANYCRDTELDPSDVFNKALAWSYKVIGLTPLHENEKLTGAEAQYLAWVESVFAKTISKFAMWNERHEDPVTAAAEHVEKHLRETGQAWVAMADNMPASAYN